MSTQHVQKQTVVHASGYKTLMCRAFTETGYCKYGDKCQFAHGPNELRQRKQHPNYKTELCRTFHSRGFCPYGPRCHFIHNEDDRNIHVSSSPAQKAEDVFSYNPYYMYRFKQALRKGKEKDRRIRINIVGNYGQGKTSLAKRLAGLTCEGVEATNGIEINLYKCKSVTGNRTIERIDDEEQYFISRMASVARSISTEEAPSVVSVASSSGNTETIQDKENSVGNYAEKVIVNSSTNISELKSFADEMESGENQAQAVLEFWDFGGQFIFYATHSLFHSRKAIYLLVFDLSSPLNTVVKDEDFLCKEDEKTMEHYARFWMESIHDFVGPEPPVILVGTHKDKLHGDDKTKQAAKDEYFENVRHLFDGTKLLDHIQEKDFAVANLDPSDAGVQTLLQVILEKGKEMTETSEIPARWIPLEKRLYQEKHKKVISFQGVREINESNDCRLADDEELKLFLLYHHERGSVIYFDEEPVSEHVVLDPKYLVDAFKRVITPDRFLTKNPSLRKERNSLITKGQLKPRLLDHVWSDGFSEDRNVLLEFLKKHHIISQVVEYDASSGVCCEKAWFIVPSLLKDHSPVNNTLLLEFLAGKSQTQVRFVMQFENPRIVLIVYHKLIAASLGKWPVVKLGKTKMLFRNLCVLQLGCNYAGIAELKNSSIELQVLNFCRKPINHEVPDSFRRFAESIVMYEFWKLKSEKDNKDKSYSRKYRCNHSKHGLEGSHRTRAIEQLESTDMILCPDNYSHQECDRSRATAEWYLESQDRFIFPEVILCEKSLSKLASAIGENWELLAPIFGLNRADIHHIKEDNPGTVMRIYSMLLKWKDNCEDKATLDVFADALKSCQGLYVDWDVVKSFTDTSRSQSKIPGLVLTDSKPDSSVEIVDGLEPLKIIRCLTDRFVESMPCTVDFECELNQVIPVQWYHNARLIEPSSKHVMSNEGTRHKLEIRDVCSKDEGKYVVTVAGQKSSANLTVDETEEETELRRLAEKEKIINGKADRRGKE
ncbi:uncharacterized protein LOC123533858 isoform X2 [Mercenaria mercenaria]|uniref:uncharacterized protein LOC123533858 isoform X2 n=1 Tax=Mercenaria mercenaria TaxID=6596 RepID=UPI00234EF224|nr:uncharacterized protein LOC123533858 isoform X2 [Mercenaria mercenaria]